MGSNLVKEILRSANRNKPNGLEKTKQTDGAGNG
jgi:hypothetical protein